MPLKNLLEIEDKLGKPAMIYIYEPSEDDTVMAAAEKAIFGSEDVAMGSHFFSFFKINSKDISDADARKRYTKSLPAMVFLDGTGREVVTLNGKSNPLAVKSKMDKAFGTQYSVSFGKQLQVFADFLERYEKVEDKLADIAKRVEDMKARLDRRDTDRSQDNLKEEETKLEAARAELRKLTEERDQILSPPVKATEKEVAQVR